MEIIESTIGNLADLDFKDLEVDYVNLHWDETRRRTQKVVSEQGVELGIRLNPDTQFQGLDQDDVLIVVDGKAIAVNVIPDDVIVVDLTTPADSAKFAYEIGNRHAPTYFSEDRKAIITPLTNPMLELLEKIHAHPKVEKMKLLNKNALSAVVSDHTHGDEKGKLVKNLEKTN